MALPTREILRRKMFSGAMRLSKPIHQWISEHDLATQQTPCLPPKPNVRKADKITRILFAGMKYAYGLESRGHSYEFDNLYLPLLDMGYDVEFFDFVELFMNHGGRNTNTLLLSRIDNFKPDLLFCSLFTDEINPKTIKDVSENTSTITLNWFNDDDWRFDVFSKHVAPNFNFCSTTSQTALEKYKLLGYSPIILSKWACNPRIYNKLDVPKKYDISFVGQAHGDRKQAIGEIRKAGLNVECFGHGWENGQVSQAQMIRIFNESKVNLNLSKTSSSSATQIKARDVEIPMCGGLLLTQETDEIHEYYAMDEIATYDGIGELIDIAKEYISNSAKRESVAEAGHAKAIREYRSEQRLIKLFKAMEAGQ